MSLAYLTHPACSEHLHAENHPESPRRLSVIRDHLISLRLMELLAEVEAPAVTREQLLRVHDAAYLDDLEDREPAPGQGRVELDPDTWMTPGTLEAARRAAGALVHATDLVVQGEHRAAFCAVRPPGHHAERDRAMGFSFYNNVAVGAAHALAVHRLKRIAIIDFDVHYGNGTENIFRTEPRVTIFSTFEEQLFPAMHVESVPGRFYNVALPSGTKGREWREIFRDSLLPALDAARPQLIYFSAGFDAHHEDPLASLALNEEDYAWLTREVAAIARRHARGRMISTLEGGYSLSALGRSAAAHIRELLES